MHLQFVVVVRKYLCVLGFRIERRENCYTVCKQRLSFLMRWCRVCLLASDLFQLGGLLLLLRVRCTNGIVGCRLVVRVGCVWILRLSVRGCVVCSGRVGLGCVCVCVLALVASARYRACSQSVVIGHVVNFMFVVCLWYVNLCCDVRPSALSPPSSAFTRHPNSLAQFAWPRVTTRVIYPRCRVLPTAMQLA